MCDVCLDNAEKHILKANVALQQTQKSNTEHLPQNLTNMHVPEWNTIFLIDPT